MDTVIAGDSLSRLERGPYGRQGNGANALANGRGAYYGQPMLKPTHYGSLVAGYLFVGGISGASQVIAAIAGLSGRNGNLPIARAGRYIALAGALASPVFLIADLETSRRWHHMLRIFRPTSAMSIGSWSLTLFGAMTGAVALGQLLADRSGRQFYLRLAQAASVPAAGAGAIVATYTGTLLGASSNPLWAAGAEVLPVLFGLSATATATAALTIAGHIQAAPARDLRRVERLSIASTAAELVATAALERAWRARGVDEALRRPPLAAKYRWGYKAAGLIAPLAIHGLRLLLRRRSAVSSLVSAAATLAGGYMLRSVLIAAGNRSAARPSDSLGSAPEQSLPPPLRRNDAAPESAVSPTERAGDLVRRLDEAARLHARQIEQKIVAIERDLVQLRDDVLRRLGSQTTQGLSARHPALDPINSALSLVAGVEYPVTSIQRSAIEQARDTLARTLGENTLAGLESPQQA